MPAIAWKAPVWTTHSSEDTEDVDEPPDNRRRSPERFRRAPIRRQSEQTSLLTKAIQGVPEQDGHEERSAFFDYKRRRSMASNLSIASTADLTSDTGLTSPARTNTPSPPPPEMTFARFNTVTSHPKSPGLDRPIQFHSSLENATAVKKPAAPTETAPKRCIQFACAGNPPKQQAPAVIQPAAPIAVQPAEAPRRPCIKFACSDRPSTTQNTPPRAPSARRAKSPATPKSSRPGPAATSPSTPRQTTPRKLGDKTRARPKYLRANSVDLTNDGSQFHEFASEMTREADWIRQDSTAVKCKLTINDTLTKENHIRRLATEAEEEAELEEEEAAAVSDEEDEEADEDDGDDDDDQDEEDDDEEDEEDDDDEDEEYGLSDGYYTDEETGFASSDESEGEEDGNMVLWTLSKSPAVRQEPVIPLVHNQSFNDIPSDSSITTSNNRRRSNMQRVKPSDVADLPDSTDFVCGTLDEDRPLEERYISSLVARRKDKLRVIPQDIDPSFPASDPEDEDGEDFYNPVHHDSDDEDFPLPGEMEDLHHEQDKSRRRRKSEHTSPRRYHSPPPKRHQSPPPRARGRSPKNLFDRRSPRRVRSPAPKAITTPLGSPKLGNHVAFNLAARPGPTTTKSLPRAGGMFHKHRRPHRSDLEDDIHIRGAIDIVKGLEKKRLRRKEKFYQKYCNRARRGQIPERKPQPGRGAERMKELGLLMAGKKDQGNYVLSI